MGNASESEAPDHQSRIARLMMQVEVYLNYKLYRQATKALNELLKLDPDHREAHECKLQIMERTGDRDAALRQLLLLAQISVQTPQADDYLQRIALRYDEAEINAAAAEMGLDLATDLRSGDEHTDTEASMPEALFRELLRFLEIVEGRVRRVRAIVRDENGARVGEFTIREQAVEPGVIVEGKVYRDDRLQHDADWLGDILKRLSARLNSAQLSRKLVRSTKQMEEAEDELRALTARAMLALARIGLQRKLVVEFDKSGPKRGPVYSFSSIELLSAIGDDLVARDADHRAADALAQFGAAVWNLKSCDDGFPGHPFAPTTGTQGDSTVAETLALSDIAQGLVALGARLRYDSADGSPLCVHYLDDDVGFAFIASEDEVAIARLEGHRVPAALGPSRSLVPATSD